MTDNWIETQIDRIGAATIFRDSRTFKITLSPRGLYIVATKGTCQAVNSIRDVFPAIQRMVDYASK
jgi:hypothetical protein